MEIISIISASIFIVIATILFSIHAKRKHIHHSQLRIPPGNFYLPLIGETFEFFKKSPDEFHKERKAKYGDIYLSHILGSPTIIVSTPDATKFILASKHKLFKLSYPSSVDRVLNQPFWHGDFHQFLRRILVPRLGPEALRPKIHDINNIARWTLSSWPQGKTIIALEETRKFAFHVILAVTCSIMPCIESLKLLDDYTCMSKGVYTIPINLPGTTFYSAMKRKKVILKFLMQIVCKREGDEVKKDDILGCLLESRDANGERMSLERVRNLLLTLLFAGHETTTVLQVWLVKYLTENPEILQRVQEEQLQIKKNEEPLCLEHLAKMNYTSQVFYETLRLANIASFSPREIVEDVEYGGYLFPKGYMVQAYYQHFHLDPQFYPEPYKFNTSRFEKPPSSYIYSPFGNGPRLCPGSELVKVESLIFIHHMVTKYRWEAVSQDKSVQQWIHRPKDGYAIIASPIDSDNDVGAIRV